VILPRKNLDDLRNIPKELKRRVKFIAVESMEEVLPVAFELAPADRAVRRARSSTKRAPSAPTAAKLRH